MFPHAALHEVVAEIEGARIVRAPSNTNLVARDVRHDSRSIEPGDIFVARRGGHDDGAKYIQSAVERGASVVVCDREIEVPEGPAVVHVPDAEIALARASSVVWGHPSFALDVVGITGTNGKTTTTWLIEQALRSLHRTVGLIGTVEHRLGARRWPTQHTTPEADDLTRLLGTMRTLGARYVAMEVSSHALIKHRVHSVAFRVAGLTNVTQDHLDFHGSLENYRNAKRSLFLSHAPAFSVLNIDDAVGLDLASRVHDPITYSTRGSASVLCATNVQSNARGITATIKTPWGTHTLRSPLVGRHNLENLLAAVGAMHALEIPLADAVESLARCPGAPGRLEPVTVAVPDAPVVLVDYAHTADALENVLTAIRPTLHPGARLLCVFGCGGDRDATKRAPMGNAVGRLADIALLTTDNPRSEDPAAIASQAETGLVAAGITPLPHASAARGYLVELDRRVAIQRAVEIAQPHDVILIAGKGHETYQEVHGVRTAFDDRVEAHDALTARFTPSARN